jgi:sugar lactone lactonase YvrE
MLHRVRLVALLLLVSCDNDVIITPTGGGGSTGTPPPPPIGGSPIGGSPSGGAPPEGGATPIGGSGAGAPQGGGDGGGGGEAPPLPCSEMVVAPAPYEQLFGFTSSEDFCFDNYGNYVGVDGNGNLVRITDDGFMSLWVPSVGSGSTAGMAALPDGSVVICDVGNGSLIRVYENGVVQTILGGLQYPNGVDVGPDGYIYVAENGDDHVRRVHPDNGTWTIAGDGMIGPNGVAFSDDPLVFYVGSFGGGIVYKVQMTDPTQPGTVTEFATGFQSGGLDGLGVDECGYVYVAEFGTGVIYRITPQGVLSVLANVPSSWIPNIKWGRGLGGFDRNVMYVADRNASSLFAMKIDREGATEYCDIAP